MCFSLALYFFLALALFLTLPRYYYHSRYPRPIFIPSIPKDLLPNQMPIHACDLAASSGFRV